MNRIDGLGTFGAGRTTQGQGAGAIDAASADGTGAAAKADGKQDSASVSARGKVMAGVLSTVERAPDVRADRVAALKAAIANGAYRVDADGIAARLLTSLGQG